MANWIVYFKINHTVYTDRFSGTQQELAEQLKHYEYIMEVRRQYD